MSRSSRPSVRNRWLLLAALVGLVLNGCSSGPTREQGGHAAPRPHPSSRSRLTGTWYRVKKGDSLWSIAWRAGVDYRTLARWNGLHRPYTIYPGQLLRLKPPARHAGSTASRSGHKHPASKPKSSTAKPGRSHGKTATAHRLHWVWPLRGSLVSRFSYSDPDKDGIEIAGKRGQKVVAAESGTVVYSGSGLIGYGQLIIIKHNNEFLSAYGHNSKLLVKEGQKVKRGQHISNLGVDNRGRALLHFEIRRYGKPVDPLSYLPR